LGIAIDSSYNRAFPQSFPGCQFPANDERKIAGVWEVPVTVFRMSYLQNGGLMPFEISAISLPEMTIVLEHTHSVGLEVVVAVFHSFSAVKPKDIFYTDAAQFFGRCLGGSRMVSPAGSRIGVGYALELIVNDTNSQAFRFVPRIRFGQVDGAEIRTIAPSLVDL
jgi:hypothetical protein